jgi:hypothetical protein
MVPFDSTVLSGVIDKRRPVATPIVDRHFGGTRMQYGTPSIQIDIKTGPEGLATAISHGAQSLRAPKDGWSTMTVTIPRFSEHDVVRTADLIGQRAPGQSVAGIPMMQRYNEKLDLIRGRFDRTLEYMALGALRGVILDGAGVTIATYDVAAAVPVVFNADGSGHDPYLVFRDAQRSMARKLGGNPGTFYAYCGDTAFDLLSNEKRIKEARTGTTANGTVAVTSGGVVQQVGSVMVENYIPVADLDLDGDDEKFVADNEILMVPTTIGGEIILGPCEAPDGPRLQEWFVDSWMERDPPANLVRIETNRMPLVRRPDVVYPMTVSGT